MNNNVTYKIIVIHGPNLNMLGMREPEIYGKESLSQIDADIKERGVRVGALVETFQSNHEGAIVDQIQKSLNVFDGLIINPAAYTHTSIAIRDALLLLDIPKIEIHLSNIYKRESFRHKSMISAVVDGQIAGFGVNGYVLALEALLHLLRTIRRDGA